MARKRKVEQFKGRTTQAPEHLSTFYEREGTREARSLHRSLNYIASNGIRGLTKEQLKQVGLPIIREAKRRMRDLKANDLTMTSAYKYVETNDLRFTTATQDLNELRKNIKGAFDFLHAKTSLVENAKEQKQWIISHLGEDLSDEKTEAIFDLVHRFENLAPGKFMDYGYDEQIKKIADVTREQGFDVEKAYSELEKYYSMTRNELSQDEELQGEVSVWNPGRTSF